MNNWSAITGLPLPDDPQFYVQLQLLLKCLLLIFVANGAPILVRMVLHGRCFNYPLDFNIRFFDSRPLLGHSKTIRGFLSAIIITPVVAVALGFTPATGLIFALFAMLGDMFSSFVKRRLDLQPSARASGLDQIPESLFPLLALKQLPLEEKFILPWQNLVLVVLMFLVLEVVLSRILYRMKIRKRPY